MDRTLTKTEAKTFGDFMKKKRDALNLSLQEAAAISGVPFSTIATLERGEIAKPKIRLLVGLQAAYGLDELDIYPKAKCIVPRLWQIIVKRPHMWRDIENFIYKNDMEV